MTEKIFNILMVDNKPAALDDPKILLENIIKASGRNNFHIDTAESGDTALKKINEKKGYDLIITDYQMPADGVWLYKNLNPEQQKKVVFCTGKTGEVRERLELELKETDFKTPEIFRKVDILFKYDKIVQTYLI